MKHKVGDRVKVKSLEWYYSLPEDYELIYGIIERGRYDHFVEDMSEYCGRIVEISDIVEANKHEYYRIKEDYEEFYWSDYMFEEEMKENMTQRREEANRVKRPKEEGEKKLT